jgi:general secretion pathway protein C
MSQRERRIQRIAVGFAAVAVALATTAVIARWPADRLRSDSVAPASRHVAAGELVKLKPGAIGQADGGIRVTDAALRGALGLGPGDTITAISGRPVAKVHELSGVLRELAAFRPRSLFVELVRDRQPVVERWQLDGDLDTARRAELAAGAAPGARDPRIATVVQLDRATYAVPRATVEAWTNDPGLVTTGGRAIPMIDAGQQAGFKLYAIHPGSAYAALGLEDGDVVRAINGTQLASGDHVLELVARSTTQITLDLLRRGQPMLLNYLIK